MAFFLQVADIILSFQLLVKSELNEMKLRRKFIYEIIDIIKKAGLMYVFPEVILLIQEENCIQTLPSGRMKWDMEKVELTQ